MWQLACYSLEDVEETYRGTVFGALGFAAELVLDRAFKGAAAFKAGLVLTVFLLKERKCISETFFLYR